MTGELTLGAEVLARLDQADAEDLLPEPIDGHTGCEGIVVGHQPLRKRQPIDGGPGRRCREGSGRSRSYRITLVQKVAADVDIRWPGLALAQDRRRRAEGLELTVEVTHFGVVCGPSGIQRTVMRRQLLLQVGGSLVCGLGKYGSEVLGQCLRLDSLLPFGLSGIDLFGQLIE